MHPSMHDTQLALVLHDDEDDEEEAEAADGKGGKQARKRKRPAAPAKSRKGGRGGGSSSFRAQPPIENLEQKLGALKAAFL